MSRRDRVQVKSDSDGLVDWVPARKLRYSCAGVEAQPISLILRWQVGFGSSARPLSMKLLTQKAYLVVGPGAKAPPLAINADGTYSWQLDSKTKIDGKWRKMLEAELRPGTKAPALLLLRRGWQELGDLEERKRSIRATTVMYTVERMDLGLSYHGTRLP